MSRASLSQVSYCYGSHSLGGRKFKDFLSTSSMPIPVMLEFLMLSCLQYHNIKQLEA